jgi:hypothetical protein
MIHDSPNNNNQQNRRKTIMKKTVLLATAFAFAFSMAVTAGISLAEDKGPAEMTLTTEAGKKPAVFNHAKHQATFECAECHHTKTADGKQGPFDAANIGKCESCHNASMTDPKLASFKEVAHTNCKGCHKDKGEPAPTKCDGCHPKK